MSAIGQKRTFGNAGHSFVPPPCDREPEEENPPCGPRRHHPRENQRFINPSYGARKSPTKERHFSDDDSGYGEVQTVKPARGQQHIRGSPYEPARAPSRFSAVDHAATPLRSNVRFGSKADMSIVVADWLAGAVAGILRSQHWHEGTRAKLSGTARAWLRMWIASPEQGAGVTAWVAGVSYTRRRLWVRTYSTPRWRPTPRETAWVTARDRSRVSCR